MLSSLPLPTARLALRPFDPRSPRDCAFIVELLNQRSFIDHIADRGVRSAEDAARYLRESTLPMYARHGCGMLAIERRADGELVGMCGLLKREQLDDHDVGYALLDRQWGWNAFGLPRIAAFTALDNPESVRLLHKLGFRFLDIRQLTGYEDRSRYFVIDAPG
jgi:RimJ/RimL family protein N-acetyltransferase